MDNIQRTEEYDKEIAEQEQFLKNLSYLHKVPWFIFVAIGAFYVLFPTIYFIWYCRNERKIKARIQRRDEIENERYRGECVKNHAKNHELVYEFDEAQPKFVRKSSQESEEQKAEQRAMLAEELRKQRYMKAVEIFHSKPHK